MTDSVNLMVEYGGLDAKAKDNPKAFYTNDYLPKWRLRHSGARAKRIRYLSSIRHDALAPAEARIANETVADE